MGGNFSSPGLDAEVRSSILQLVMKQEVGDGSFVAREEAEWTHLVKALAAEPSRVTLLFGPERSGKSKLLQHLQHTWQLPCPIRQIFSPFLLINLHNCLHLDRSWGTYHAQGLRDSILNQIRSWLDMATATLDSRSSKHIHGIPRASIGTSLASFSESLQECKSIHGLLELLQTSLRHNKHVRPIIVLDEAHVLQTWHSYAGRYYDGKYYKDLDEEIRRLSQFSMWLCKDIGTGHVVMASSAPFFWSWVSETLEITPLKMLPVGHLSKVNAKKFLIDILVKYQGSLPEGEFSEDVWESVYQVTGGSPSLLKTVASDASELGSWTDATESIVSFIAEEIRATVVQLAAGPYDKFVHLEGIIGAIVDSGGLAGFDKLIMDVFAGDESTGRSLIRKLAEKGIVHVRLWMRGMKYMDAGEKQGDDTLYVMAANPASFAAMKKLYPAWFGTIGNGRRDYSQGGIGGGSEGDLDKSVGESDYATDDIA